MTYEPVINPEELRKHYSKTLKEGVVLLTAHSHQAWPDIIEDAQLESVRTAFSGVDLKWDYIFGEIIPRFQQLISTRIGNKHPQLIANGENTHELVTRVMSCFPWNDSTQIVTTDSEFHSVKRQLYRLKEEGVGVEFVPAGEKKSLTERIINAITPKTSLVIVSSVFFNDGYIFQGLNDILNKTRETGSLFLLDAYHHFNIRRLNLNASGDDFFVTAGGYKYAQAGEGAAWLKVPVDSNLRPRITGWFADFNALKNDQYPSPVNYGDGAERFLGATRDVSGIFRQIAVLEFMNDKGMTVECLEENNLKQTSYLIDLFDSLAIEEHGVKLVSSRNDKERGPFLTLNCGSSQTANKIQTELWEKYKVLTDTRGNNLRIGPAPYTTGYELEYCIRSIEKIIGV